MAEQPATSQATKPKQSKPAKHKHTKAVAKTKHLSSHSTTKRAHYVSVPVSEEAGQEQLTNLFHSPTASSEEDFAGFPDQPAASHHPPILPPRAHSSSQPAELHIPLPLQALPSNTLGPQLSHEFISQLQDMLAFYTQTQPQSPAPAVPQRSVDHHVRNETDPSCSPNPFDIARGRFVDDASCGEDPPFATQAEGVEWSDQSEQEEDTSYRLFDALDYQPLARRVLNTLGLQSTQPAAATPAIKGARVLKSPTPAEHYLPVPDPIAKLAKDKWSHPLQTCRFNALVDRLYFLAPDFTSRPAVPGIDEPISSLVSISLLPREGDSHLKDATERRLDFALRKNHEATAFSMRASASASIFSRAAMMWLDDLLDDPNPDPVSLRRSLMKLRKTAAFVADATFDTNQLEAQAMAAQVVARWTLWLRHWQADSTARVNLSRAPYSSSLLFGEEALKAVLVDPKDARKPVLATVRNVDRRPFRGFTSYRTTQPFRGMRPGGRGRDFRTYDFRPSRGVWNRRFPGRGLRLASQFRQKPSPTNPTPTTSRGDVGHPAGDGVPVSRPHNCYHRHLMVSDAPRNRRRHASSQGSRNVGVHHPYCAMGSSSYSPTPVGFVAVSAGHCQVKSSSNSLEPRTASFIPLVDEGPTSHPGHSVQRTPQDCYHHRCQSPRLGSPLQLPVRSGGLDHIRADSEHQLAGTEGCL
ncbi:integrator complex subunit 13 isoform X3 [Rhineura floridana]|uniref:integrator complex subunit 13 isoform X3 n=1 Tax=Rhineura floridana TaxID=261503 RepID=UPI002AC8794B|nr:integrator complex subunit 13 isoform X3 [Rhineura floridana]XP_061438193.1 integrator complex subunit 13 isoform X3 [Rhineura floridana]XP_061438194.1 integrator complex subunit 13 isoform X3 [Rhineura floridana]XP_061438195.1 integrator complex subunit 13 isoform X3 [Rhineura floridana]